MQYSHNDLLLIEQEIIDILNRDEPLLSKLTYQVEINGTVVSYRWCFAPNCWSTMIQGPNWSLIFLEEFYVGNIVSYDVQEDAKGNFARFLVMLKLRQ
jgi:hypothetical protein